ncbi:MAG: hypothetical protein APF84_09665 [Gracilibacter sp. BRH_c7a]|nr:MAG: hypothetical protein APF84_09665 [Gracilibacter sp. BRH_c7a]
MKKSYIFKTLKFKIIAPIIIVVVFGTLVLTGSSYFLAQEVIKRNIEELASSKASELTAKIESEFRYNMNKISTLSETEAVRSLNWQEIDDSLLKRTNQYIEYEEILLADEWGDYVSTSSQAGSIAERSYFNRALSGEDVISEPIISKLSGDQVIVFASPVRDIDGNIKAVIAGSYKFDNISDIAADYKLGDKGYAYIIDNNGLVLYHPTQDMLATSMLVQESDSLLELTQKMINAETGTGVYESESVAKMMAYGPLGTNGWSMAMTADHSEVTQDLDKLLRNSIIIILLVLVIIISSAWVIVTRITRPILSLGQAAQQVAAGDLRVRVNLESEDEIGSLTRSFNTMIDSIKALLNDMQRTGETLAASSQEIQAATEESAGVSESISQTMQQVSQGVSDQASAAQKGNEVVSEVVTGLGGMVQSMDNSQRMTDKARTSVESGVGFAHYQKEKMDESKQATHVLNVEITNLSEISKQIYEIIQVISGIAEQTNLLALNAAIEAARAGEQGRGFAVVAEEVRKLAEQSGEATDRIDTLIKGIQGGVAKAVQEMERAGAAINEQEGAVISTNKAFEDIRSLIIDIAEDIKKVHNDSEILSERAKVAGYEIENIASIAQESAAASEEVAASSQEQTASIQQIAEATEDLAKLGVSLQEAIRKFKL